MVDKSNAEVEQDNFLRQVHGVASLIGAAIPAGVPLEVATAALITCAARVGAMYAVGLAAKATDEETIHRVIVGSFTQDYTLARANLISPTGRLH